MCRDVFARCTLRAAVQEANALSGDDTITFNLTTPAIIEMSLGHLSISSNVTLIGPGTRQLAIVRSFAATANFSVLAIEGNAFAVTISDLRVSNGSDIAGIVVGPDRNLTLNRVAISENQSGGIYNRGTLVVINSIIDSNGGRGLTNLQGGVAGGFVNISNTTISRNVVANTPGFDEGGGIHNSHSIVLNNVTVTGNSAGDAAGGIANFGSVKMRNTIVADNTAPISPNVKGSFCGVGNHSMGNNLVSDASGSTCLINGIDGDIVGQLARIGPILDNGGATLSYALSSSSPAQNSGNGCVVSLTCPDAGAVSTNPPVALQSDQRGFQRPVGTIDIGSLETQGPVNFTGKISRPSGSAMPLELVTLSDLSTGEIRFTTSNPFGNFQFLNVPNNHNYTITIRHKKFIIPPQTFFSTNSRTDIVFAAPH